MWINKIASKSNSNCSSGCTLNCRCHHSLIDYSNSYTCIAFFQTMFNKIFIVFFIFLYLFCKNVSYNFRFLIYDFIHILLCFYFKIIFLCFLKCKFKYENLFPVYTWMNKTLSLGDINYSLLPRYHVVLVDIGSLEY